MKMHKYWHNVQILSKYSSSYRFFWSDIKHKRTEKHNATRAQFCATRAQFYATRAQWKSSTLCKNPSPKSYTFWKATTFLWNLHKPTNIVETTSFRFVVLFFSGRNGRPGFIVVLWHYDFMTGFGNLLLFWTPIYQQTVQTFFSDKSVATCHWVCQTSHGSLLHRVRCILTRNWKMRCAAG